MTERAPNTFRQWRPPSERRIEREEDASEMIYEEICTNLEQSKRLLERLNVIPHNGRHGSIDLKVSNDILVDAGEIPESYYDSSDPHEETTLSFAYFTQAYEVPTNAEETREEVTYVYEIGTTTSVPSSFMSLPEHLYIEALEALDGSFEADESTDAEIIDTLKYYDDPQTAFRIYQDLVVMYDVDPRLRDVQYRYEISYSLYQNDDRVATLHGEAYSSEEGRARKHIVHDPLMDDLTREVVVEIDMAHDHETLDPGEYILTTESFNEIVSNEEARGTGMISGMSTLQSMKVLQKMVNGLPR